MQKIRNAFTMLELIFVIVIMGIIGTFGTEFLAQSYNSFIYSQINNRLQSNSSTTLEFIATRLQHRVKDSVIARVNGGGFTELVGASGIGFDGFEWIASDVDNFRGTTAPNWSGLIDLNNPLTTANALISPETNTTAIDTNIRLLSDTGGTTIANSALYFIGAGHDINGYGWDDNDAGTIDTINDQSEIMHPIRGTISDNTFVPRNTNFDANSEVSEYYKLAWTANAVILEEIDGNTNIGNLYFYYDYQPWDGENYQNGQKVLLMEGVRTFQAAALGSTIKIQVCTSSTIIDGEDPTSGGYSLCKEKTIF